MPIDESTVGAAGEPQASGGVSRRDVVRMAGAGAFAAALAPWQQAQAAPPRRWDHEADLVIVGTGAAGLTAALVAKQAGRSVILVEKLATVGGTSWKSGGIYWIPNNSWMRAEGVVDNKADCLRYMARLSFPALYNPADAKLGLAAGDYALLETYYEEADKAVTALGAMGALRTRIRKQRDHLFPDYYPKLEENKAPAGRGLLPDPPDGKPVDGGEELIRQLKAAVEQRRIPILLQHRADRVVVNGRGEVVGLEAGHEGRSVRIRARRGVVFGSGGFIQNPRLCEQFLKGPVFGGCGEVGSEGDFITIAGRVGAQLGNMTNAWWGQVIVEEALVTRSVPSMSFYIPGDSIILVDAYGRRCVNEKSEYNERGQSHFRWDLGRAAYSAAIQFAVYDESCRQKSTANGGVVPKPGVAAPHVLTGATLDDLARAIQQRLAQIAHRTGGYQIDPEFVANLRDTIERFNGFARSGVDHDFRRGQSWTGSQWVYSDGGNVAAGAAAAPAARNASMAPLSTTGPYYAVMMGAGALDTNGGPRINTHAQVLTVDDKPIPGLYGAGNCIASPAGQGYWAGGGTIGPAMTFGYLAALHASAEPVRPEA